MAKAKAATARAGDVEPSMSPAEARPDTLYVSSVDREIAVGAKVFMFKAGVPRQLPGHVTRYAMGMGIDEAT